MWLGAAGLVDIVVTQNFASVDRFLYSPGSIEAKADIQTIGHDAVRQMLRRNAGEENAWIFEMWEWVQVGLIPLFFFMVLFGERPPKLALILIPLIFMIVLLQRFALTPTLTNMGREVQEMPPVAQLKNPRVGQFWILHGFYSGFEILKLALGFAVGVRLGIRRKSDHSRAQDREMGRPVEVSGGAPPDRRVRKRRAVDSNG